MPSLRALSVALALALLPSCRAAGSRSPAKEIEMSSPDAVEVRQVAARMLESWYGGDGDGMAAVLHDQLAKRGVLSDPQGKPVFLQADKAQMVAGARAGAGRIPREDWDIHAEVLDLAGDLATVKVVSAYLIDVCQLARLDGRWQIVNVLWTTRGQPPWMRAR